MLNRRERRAIAHGKPFSESRHAYQPWYVKDYTINAVPTLAQGAGQEVDFVEEERQRRWALWDKGVAEGADWHTIVTTNDALFDRVFDFVEFGEFFDL